MNQFDARFPGIIKSNQKLGDEEKGVKVIIWQIGL